MLRDYLIASARTGVTILLGLVAGWLADRGFDLSAGVQTEISALAMFVLYMLIAGLERKWPKFGWLLGWGKGAGPSFEKPTAPTPVE
jgi:hypothetical protein